MWRVLPSPPPNLVVSSYFKRAPVGGGELGLAMFSLIRSGDLCVSIGALRRVRLTRLSRWAGLSRSSCSVFSFVSSIFCSLLSLFLPPFVKQVFFYDSISVVGFCAVTGIWWLPGFMVHAVYLPGTVCHFASRRLFQQPSFSFSGLPCCCHAFYFLYFINSTIHCC